MNARATHRRRVSRRAPAYACEHLENRRLLAATVPILNSAPGAPDTLFLDFDGAPAFIWNNRDADGMLQATPVHGAGANDVPVPGFTMDANPADFNEDENREIENIWRAVVGKFGIFNVNVTTVDPGHRTDGQVAHVLIGGSNSDWNTGGGGIASIGSYNEADEDNTCFVWSGDMITVGTTTLVADRVSAVVETAVHEAGHVYGLTHQRSGGTVANPTAEYYGGDATRVPIMGNSNQNATIDNDLRSIWWQTNFEPGQMSPDSIRNELADLDNAGLDYAADDYNSSASIFLAHNPSTGEVGQDGIINSLVDVDAFRFVADGPVVQFRVSSENAGRMLAPEISLRSYPALDLMSAPVVRGRLSATLTATNLVPGQTYALNIGSRFSDAFDIGGYDITGTVGRFARINPGTGTVEVFGWGDVNNNIRVKVENTGALVITNTVGGGFAEFRTAAFETPRISVDTGTGNDVITFEKIGPIPIDVDGGAGTNTLRLQGSTTDNRFNVRTWPLGVLVEWQAAGSGGGGAINTTIGYERANLDVFAGSSTGTTSLDLLTVTPQAIASDEGSIRFFGNGGTDHLEIAASTINTPQEWYFSDGFVSLADPSTIAGFVGVDFDAAVENVSILTGTGDDFFKVYAVPTGKSVIINGNDGADVFEVGESTAPPFGVPQPFSQSVRGTVTLTGGQGIDRLEVDDAAYGSVGNYAIDGFSARNTFTGTPGVSYDQAIDRVDFRGRGGGSTTLTTALASQEFRLTDGGGGGVGGLVVDDRTGLAGAVSIDFHPDRIIRNFSFGAPRSIYYSGHEAVTLFSANSTNLINVYGTSPGVAAGQQTTIITGTGSDTIVLYPFGPELAPDPGVVAGGAAGQVLNAVGTDLTFVTPLGVLGGGGTDTMLVDSTGSATPIDYLFNNPFGSGTANIFGLGAAGVGALNDVENVVVRGGGGNDTFTVSSFKTGTALNIAGGEGDDLLQFGADNLPANVTSISAFNFDGEGGADTFNFNNAIESNQWAYSVSATGIAATRNTGGGYFIGLSRQNTERFNLNAGPGVDVASLAGVAAGETFAFNAGEGGDGLNLPANLTPILGPVAYDGGGGFNNLNQISNSATAPSTLHVTQDSVGAFPGDDFFPAGASLHFVNISNLTLTMGSGADTAFVQPNPDATINLRGGGAPAGPGDTLTLALASAEDYAVNGTSASGNVTSTNLKTLTFSGFEAGPHVDDAAPVADIVDVAPDPRGELVTSIDIVFGEPVAGFEVADLALTRGGGANLLTGAETLTTSDGGTTWTLGELAALTANSGTYVLAMTANGSAITDAAGNTLDDDADETWMLSLPAWLAATDDATWNVASKALTVFGPVTIIADPGPDAPLVLGNDPAAVVTIDPAAGSAVNLGGLHLSGGARITVSSDGATRTLFVPGASFTLDDTATLDLGDNAVVLLNDGSGDAAQAVARRVAGYLKAGLENGGNYDWLGAGLSSAEAAAGNAAAGSVLYGLGLLQNNLAAAGTPDGTTTDEAAANEIYTSFGDHAVSLNDVLVRHTYMGDADLDGSITGTDYSLIDAGFAASLAGWLNGDFDYSGAIDGTDYALIDNAFASQVGPLSMFTATLGQDERTDRESLAASVVA